MAKKPFNIHDAILILVSIGFVILLYFAFSYGAQHQITEDPSYIRCGMCDAHVTEWWFVRNDNDTAFIETCSKCYDIIKKGNQ